MATAVRERNGYRIFLQGRLAEIPKLREQYSEAGRRLAEALEAIRNGDRPMAFADRFQREVDKLAKELSELQNSTPKILLDSCTDEDLRSEWQVTKRLRQRAATEVASAQQELQSVEEQISKLKGRLAENRGPSQLADNGKPKNWAIVGNELLMNPDVIPAASVDRYAAEWRAIRREISIAQEGLIAAEQRHAELDAKVNSIRQQMINSPV